MILAQFLTAAACVPLLVSWRPELEPSTVFSILFMGFVQIGVAMFFFAYGIRRVSAAKAMLTASIEPILNPLWVLLATGEKPAASSVAGGVIIIAAVLVSSVNFSRQDHQQRPR